MEIKYNMPFIKLNGGLTTEKDWVDKALSDVGEYICRSTYANKNYLIDKIAVVTIHAPDDYLREMTIAAANEKIIRQTAAKLLKVFKRHAKKSEKGLVAQITEKTD